MAEGFDNAGEDGAGEKLLSALQKMDVANIMCVVLHWQHGLTGGATAELK